MVFTRSFPPKDKLIPIPIYFIHSSWFNITWCDLEFNNHTRNTHSHCMYKPIKLNCVWLKLISLPIRTFTTIPTAFHLLLYVWDYFYFYWFYAISPFDILEIILEIEILLVVIEMVISIHHICIHITNIYNG